MSTSAKELQALRKEELVQWVLELQEENVSLQREVEELRRCSPRSKHLDVNSLRPLRRESGGLRCGTPTRAGAASPNGKGSTYTLSFSVMLIENGTAISVPLSSVIDKSYMRPDLRDADTPVVASSLMRDDYDAESFPRHSVGSLQMERSPSASVEEPLGRSSELRGFGGGACAAPSVASSGAGPGPSVSGSGGGRPSISFDFVPSDDANEPAPQDPASGQPPLTAQQLERGLQGQEARHRSIRHELRRLSLGRVLNKRSVSLDADALVSCQTLRTFHRQMLEGVRGLSPLSSHGNAIYHYIVKNFAVRNGCRHSPGDVEGFGRTLCSLCGEVKALLQSEPRHGSTVSPCYVFGDLHGNFLDLFYFLDNLISFQDLRYTPHRFLFLGDYVDRGDFSVEVVAYLFSMKVLAPEKVLLLRGNHEDTLVSGDISGYGNTSFRAQCRNLFGHALGEELWQRASETFAYLPLTANIDGRIFCAHGGIPRYRGGVDDRMQVLCRDDFPALETLFNVPEEESPRARMCRQMAIDTCWADPAEDEGALDKWGFGANPRGSGVILFGSAAVDQFLANYNFEYIFRAHQEKSDGLKLSKSARVFTIFSTSAYVGHENGAGVVLVADGKIRLIIKSADDCAQAGDEEEEEEDGEDGDGGTDTRQ
ncbi:putative serine/threonine protein phosphatase [Trypanosoma conorhini]|uniref:Serine/threonine-protein phosphatase n=1 Tax=Trypanosoma conorhini TaxID=83891 RepID=A0A3R7PR77_9TRYP|nr:putative serine/threonine protein phosphatase [Trypanosoma conorhini]RNF23952.1 putative serine/threonine protein phosphatase [Trypanosoma conorhini]